MQNEKIHFKFLSDMKKERAGEKKCYHFKLLPIRNAIIRNGNGQKENIIDVEMKRKMTGMEGVGAKAGEF